MKKKNKTITYNITEAQVDFIQKHTLNFLYDRTIYWLYSERMELYYPFLLEKKKSRIHLEELLSYCKNQGIFVFPMTLRKTRLRSSIANRIEIKRIREIGLLLKNPMIIRLINEYSKYCLVKYPIHIPSPKENQFL